MHPHPICNSRRFDRLSMEPFHISLQRLRCDFAQELCVSFGLFQETENWDAPNPCCEPQAKII
ncbi:hypothetical protein AB205_0072350 [Aquarana catesbeiana]|uniref:Uncharacterized protein n=1 Tax=Aquarana catesbeiana TaxID=8400 RepID=A0A2G9RM74_AQUCT|nr:hypothetical protein AB205_0072350 [Aquarana catesbeiana]